MCGIVGYKLLHRPETDLTRLLAMLRAIRHRGPDDEGIMLVHADGTGHQDLVGPDSAPGVRDVRPLGSAAPVPHRIAFGHRRFSIVDLSVAAHQPFWSGDGSICVSFNGEIYNFHEIRSELTDLGHEFHTSSDTEVLVQAYLAWGPGAFEKLNGIWALSVYDARDDSLLLARDRIGKIPLYLSRTSEGLFWASEIKALHAALGTAALAVDDQAVTDFVVCGDRDLGQRTFFSSIEQLPRAHWARVRPDGSLDAQRYWDIPTRRLTEDQISIPDAVARLRELLADAVRIRLRVDVPIGFELSGGMDSSTLVAVGASQLDELDTYTVSFPGTPADEEPYARQVADSLGSGVRYHVLLPESGDFFAQADSYVALMGEPFHLPSMLTNFQIWRQMHGAGVRVCINGGGGDELFAGYGNQYFRPFLRYLLRHGEWKRALQEYVAYTERNPWSLAPRSMYVFARSLYHASRRLAFGRNGLPARVDPFVAPVGIRPWAGPSDEVSARLIELVTDARMSYWLASDNQSYMGIPIELRLPLLDYRLIEFAFSLPLTYLIRGGWLKWILREAMRDRLPPDVVWRRRKMGFPFPLREWLPTVRHDFFSVIDGTECPYIDSAKLRAGYAYMAHRSPDLLWRQMSLMLWWKRCIRGEALSH